MKRFLNKWVFSLLLVVAAISISGCATMHQPGGDWLGTRAPQGHPGAYGASNSTGSC